MSDPEFDTQLWFTLDGCCADRHYLLHNPHTFPGRMAAWCPLKKVRFNISKSKSASARTPPATGSRDFSLATSQTRPWTKTAATCPATTLAWKNGVRPSFSFRTPACG